MKNNEGPYHRMNGGKVKKIPAPASKILPEIQYMLDNEGIYIGAMPELAIFEVPIISLRGKLYPIELDEPLAPERFIAGAVYNGPFRFSTKILKEQDKNG